MQPEFKHNDLDKRKFDRIKFLKDQLEKIQNDTDISR